MQLSYDECKPAANLPRLIKLAVEKKKLTAEDREVMKTDFWARPYDFSRKVEEGRIVLRITS
jgi:hypothetical protein